VAVTPDSEYAVTASNRGAFRAWDLEDGTSMFVSSGLGKAVGAVGISYDELKSADPALNLRWQGLRAASRFR
jgi:hypothetical protein